MEVDNRFIDFLLWGAGGKMGEKGEEKTRRGWRGGVARGRREEVRDLEGGEFLSLNF